MTVAALFYNCILFARPNSVIQVHARTLGQHLMCLKLRALSIDTTPPAHALRRISRHLITYLYHFMFPLCVDFSVFRTFSVCDRELFVFRLSRLELFGAVGKKILNNKKEL